MARAKRVRLYKVGSVYCIATEKEGYILRLKSMIIEGLKVVYTTKPCEFTSCQVYEVTDMVVKPEAEAITKAIWARDIKRELHRLMEEGIQGRIDDVR